VSMVPSTIPSGMPVSGSSSRTRASSLGRPRRQLPTKSPTTLTPLTCSGPRWPRRTLKCPPPPGGPAPQPRPAPRPGPGRRPRPRPGSPTAAGRGRRRPARRRSAASEQALLGQPIGGELLLFLLVHVHELVELGQLLGGDLGRDGVKRLLDLVGHGVLAPDGDDVLGRLERLVLLQHHPVV